MKRIVLVTHLVFSIAISRALAQKIETNQPDRGRIIRVETALNHLTVIEVGEPITMVAAGSPAFRVERRDNKVFIQPLEEGQSTNLFIWTQTTRHNYELVAAGGVEGMHFAIDHLKPESMTRQSAQSQQAEAAAGSREILSKALMASQPIKVGGLRLPKGRVGVFIQEVFHTEDQLLIRYAICNQGKEPYRHAGPKLTLLKSPKSNISLIALSHAQLGKKETRRLTSKGRIPLEVLQTQMQSKVVEPGQQTIGLVAIKTVVIQEKPVVLELSFPKDRGQTVAAVLVL
jgi:hypothetical protein